MQEGIRNRIRELVCRDIYLSRIIEPDVLREILECVKYTPSAGNIQPWEIIIVTDSEIRSGLTETLLDPFLREDGGLKQKWIGNASLILVLCMDIKRSKLRFGERGIEFGLMDIGAAALSLLLGAWDHGLKGCSVREFDQDKAHKVLELPIHVTPLLLIAIGYSNQEKAFTPTLELDDFVHKERWTGVWES